MLGRRLTAAEVKVLGSSQEWEDLVSDHYGADSSGRAVGVADCVALLRERQRFETSEAGASADPAVQSSAEMARVQALSLYRWSIATADDEVRAFRTQVLGDDLIAIADVGGWVASRAETEGRGEQVRLEDGRWVSALKLRHPSIDGAVETETWIRTGGDLDRLRWLCERLVRDHRWQPGQATTFVLTDAVPIVSPLRVTTSEGSGSSRILLDVDPDTPSDVVAAAYADARAELRGDRRRPSEHSLRLTSMWLSHDQPQFAWLARRWNAENSRHINHRSANQTVTRTLGWLSGSAE